LAPLCWGFQTDLIYPWITNNDQFQATIIINNLNDTEVTVMLEASRQTDNDPTNPDPITIQPFGQFVATAASLFSDDSGDPSGYTVRLESEADNITGAFIIVGTGSASGSSPSQANVFSLGDATPIILFNSLSISDDGFSAPVVVNDGQDDADVIFHAYQNGVEVGSALRTIPIDRPLAELTSSLFPDVTGNIYVVVESDEPLLGVAFIFNDLLEPSMANAVGLAAVPVPDGGGGDPVSFSSDIQPIFNNFCSPCHTTGTSGGLSLAEGSAFGNIVGATVLGAGFGSFNRIEPGNVADSYLWRKLQSGADADYFGNRMPLGRTPLSDENMQLLVNWIEQGAQDN
jgi:hypothetical protein